MNGNNGRLCYISKFSYLLTDKQRQQADSVKWNLLRIIDTKENKNIQFFNIFLLKKYFGLWFFSTTGDFIHNGRMKNEDKIYSLRLAINDKLSSCRDVFQISCCIRKHLFSTASSIPLLWFLIYRTCIKKQSSKYGLRKLLRF